MISSAEQCVVILMRNQKLACQVPVTDNFIMISMHSKDKKKNFSFCQPRCHNLRTHGVKRMALKGLKESLTREMRLKSDIS